ncbi:MAG: ABC transporter permease, partial [Ardenticatenaceae bacterium]
MLRPLFIAWLEVKRFLADRGDIAFSIALPIALFALMYGVFSGEASFNGTAHIVDLDNGPTSRKLLARLEAVDGLDIELYTLDEADSALDDSSILTAIVIPEGFSKSLQAGEPASLLFKRRGSGGDEG